MLPELHYILFGRVDTEPSTTGRLIRGMSAPDALVVTGSTLDRILQYLKEAETASLPELVAGTGSARSAIQTQLRNLIDAGRIETIAIKGCVTEYALSCKTQDR